MSEPATSVEQKIILTTIECIETYGISGATNRRIAEAAGVNIAAINYYFRSKEILIQRVMEITLKNAFDLSDLGPMPEANARERCAALFTAFLEGGRQFPNLTRAHFHNLLVEGQPDAGLQAHVQGFIDTTAQDLLAHGSSMSLGELKPVLMQLFWAVVMAVLAPGLVELGGVTLTEPAARQAYMAGLVEKLLS